MNLEKSELEPKQDFDFVGYQFDLRSGRVRLTPDRWQNLQEKMLKLLSLPACLVREFMPLIGLLTGTEKQVHLGRLHMRPILQIPPGLSPTYTGTSKNVSATGLAGELREIRARAQTRLRFCRLPVRPQVWSGPTDSRPVAEPSRENAETAIPTGLAGPGIHVLDRFTNSYRKASSSRATLYETHSVASQKQLEGTRITRKGDPIPQVPAPPFTMVAEGGQCTYRPTITPNITCSANFYRLINRRVGCSLSRAHCKRNLVPSGKQAACKLSRTKSSLSGFKRVSRPLLKQDSTCSNRQHHSSVIHKQGRRHEVGPTLCPSVENLDLVYQETSDSKARYIPGRLNVVADKLSRLGQTIQTEWFLLPEVFHSICSRWHRPKIDLFATRFNNK